MDAWTDTTNNLINELSEGTLSASVDATASVLRHLVSEIHRLRDKDAARDAEFHALAEKDATREAAMASLGYVLFPTVKIGDAGLSTQVPKYTF